MSWHVYFGCMLRPIIATKVIRNDTHVYYLRPTCLKSCLCLCMMNLVFPILGWLDPEFGHVNSMFCDKRERLYLLCVPYSFKFLHLSVCYVLSFSPLDLYILMSCYRMWWNVLLLISSSRVLNLHLEVYYFTQWRTKTLLESKRVVPYVKLEPVVACVSFWLNFHHLATI